MEKQNIQEIFEYINRTSEYRCDQTSENEEILSYVAQVNLDIRGQNHKLVIDVNFYLQSQNTTVFIMYLSNGFWGENAHYMDQLLLRLNSITQGGAFAYWPSTGDIVYKNDFPTDYLDRDKVLRILRFFENVYIAIKPKLEFYATEWNLLYITEEKLAELTNDLDWFFTGISRGLLE
jgi:hypothetical protein